MNAQIESLKSALPFVPERQKDFAGSLIQQFGNKGKLSDKQWHWVQKLAADAEQAKVPDFSYALTSDEAKAAAPLDAVGSMSGLIELFAKAKSKLQYPAIVLALPDGSPLRVHIAGPHSKTPGFIQVTDGGGYSAGKWYGRVSPAGVWEKSKATETDAQLAHAVRDLLGKLSEDPAGTAAAYGAMTGCCCFCAKKLTDEKSTAVGYGATCAKSFGLPWGKKPQ